MSTPSAAMLLRDSLAAARAARLRYVSVDEPGHRRQKRGKKFSYVGPDGRRVTDEEELRRIAKLAIPPAWTEVWICASADGHIQAVGLDVRGRKQYRYHERWREVRDRAKYEDALLFAQALPKLRAKIGRDIAEASLTKDKVVATVLKIMDMTRIRVGNDRYAAENDSYGLSTLQDHHATIVGERVEFRFKGKGGKLYRATLNDARLAKIVKRCRDVPGQRLFQYVDERGAARPITSTDVNDYIRRVTGHPFTAKEVRTWSATVSAAMVLYRGERSQSTAHAKRRIKASIEIVATQLGNTQAICRKSYVHPAVIESYLSGVLHDEMEHCLAAARSKRKRWLLTEECAVLAFFDTLGERTPIAA